MHLSALPVHRFHFNPHFCNDVLKFVHLSLLLDHYLLLTVHPLAPRLLVFPELSLKLSLQKLQTLLILSFKVLLDQIFGLRELCSAVAKSCLGFGGSALLAISISRCILRWLFGNVRVRSGELIGEPWLNYRTLSRVSLAHLVSLARHHKRFL